MGMYTDLKCKAKIKAEFCDKIDQLINNNKKWDELFGKNIFTTDDRAQFIPLGVSEYTTFNEDEMGGRFKNNLLEIKCSLKDYIDTYDKFYEFLKTISEEIIEYKTHFEEDYDYNKRNKKIIFWNNYLTNCQDEEIVGV